jgi:dephospho-CoA kinase
MIKIGLTGGIGSGKTTVAEVFRELGAPIYLADVEAKKFLFNLDVQSELILNFGQKVVSDGEVNKAVLASIVFSNKQALTTLNEIIHPRLRKHYLDWCKEHEDYSYTIMEAAILFENGFDQLVDKSIVVTAPTDQRIERAMSRDNSNKEQVQARINNQWSQEALIARSDFIIDNHDNALILPQIMRLHDRLLQQGPIMDKS